MVQKSEVSIKIKQSWDDLMIELGKDNLSPKIFEDLVHRYSEKHRVYHRISRVLEMLNEYEKFAKESGMFIERGSFMKLSIWFQHIVCQPTSCNNEKVSAHLAYSIIKEMGFKSNAATYVCAAIIATSHDSDLAKHPARIIADIDLACLAKPRGEFLTDRDMIRREYMSYITAHQFKNCQENYFRPILERKSIYYTPYFQEKFEDTARLNVEALLR